MIYRFAVIIDNNCDDVTWCVWWFDWFDHGSCVSRTCRLRHLHRTRLPGQASRGCFGYTRRQYRTDINFDTSFSVERQVRAVSRACYWHITPRRRSVVLCCIVVKLTLFLTQPVKMTVVVVLSTSRKYQFDKIEAIFIPENNKRNYSYFNKWYWIILLTIFLMVETGLIDWTDWIIITNRKFKGILFNIFISLK